MPVSLCEWRVRIGTFAHWISDYEIKERKERLLKERIRRMKVLCERLKAKMDDSEQNSEGDDEGESREDGSSPMKRKHCPHKTTNIQSSGDSDIKDLLTSCDQCIHDLLTPSHCWSTDLLTPADGCIRKLLKPCDNGVKDMITPDYRSVKDLIRSRDYNVKDLITPEDCSVRDLITPEDCSVKDLITPEDCSVRDLITPEDCNIKDIITPESCNIRDLITPEDCTVKDLITPEDCSVKDLITPEDCSIKDLIMPEDCSIKDLIMPEDCSIKDLITLEDCSIKDLITPEECSVKDLITPEDCSVKDLITPEDCSVKDLITPEDCSVKDLITPEDCSVRDLTTPEDCSLKDLMMLGDCRFKDLITPEHGSVKYLISPDNSQVKGVFGQNVPEFNFSSALSQIKPRSKELKKSNDKSVDVLRTATDENKELVTPFVESKEESVTESCSTHHHALSDTSFKEHLSTNKSLTSNKLNNIVDAGVNSYSRIKQTLSQCSAKQQVTSPCLETHKGLGPQLEQSDHLSVGLLESAVSVGEDLLQLSDFCIHEPRRSGDSFFKDNRKTREPYTSGKEQHAGPGAFTNERPIRTNAVIEDQVSSESCKHFQTSTDTSVEETSSVMVPDSSRDYFNNKRHGKAKPKETCTSSCPGSSLKSKTGLIPEEIPPISELLLLRSGDVELNPGPRQGPGWSLDLERELLSLVTDVSPAHYYDLCNALDCTHAQSQGVLSKHHWDFPTSLFEIICSWGVKQRDGTNYKEVLAEKLRSVNLDALGRKLLQGGYRMTEPPAPADLDPQDTPQPLIEMTEEQVIKCGEDLKTLYLEEICKIKTDPLDFNSVLEFERIYTNLTLLNSKTPLDYTALLTTKVNGIPPKRLMVEGEGGVGKSTFCSKIAFDWANGSTQFENFTWVLVIPLRNVIKGQTIGDIVKKYLSDSNAVTPAQIDNYILCQPTKVLIVLDGLDEYDGDLSAEDKSDISQILLRKKCKDCIVLVTTRPWRADQIKSNRDLSLAYAYVEVKGFSADNVSSYIKKYFADDGKTGSELIRFIKVNDVIRENMAPFPIYVAMLCILWKNSDNEKRETIRRLKTFSQLFDQMVMFLRDHYVSKVTKVLDKTQLNKEMKNTELCMLAIGQIALSGLLERKMAFDEEDFMSCKTSMVTCCRIGVLTREMQNISRWERNLRAAQSVTTSVFFPHKLFQEYTSALYLASLYDTDRKKYDSFLDRVMSVASPEEFCYLLYFTAAQGKDVGLDIVEKIQQNKVENCHQYFFKVAGWDTERAQRTRGRNDFLVDITFEAYKKDTAKSVGRRIFAEDKILTIDEDMSAHTMSGYLFIMEQHGMETLIFRGRSCGPTVSRDLADFLSSSSSLSRLEFHRTTLDEDFYRLLQDRASSAGVTSVKELYVDHQFLGDLHRFDFTVGDLFPSLQQLRLTSPQTVRPGFVERLTHPNLSVLSIESVRYDSNRSLKDGEEWPVPFIGEPASLGQLFSSSFPHLISLTFRDLVIGNVRCKAILHSLRNHKHIKSISFTNCFTDDSLDCLASEISKENGITVSLQHDSAQQQLDLGGDSKSRLAPDLMDALCHGTCVRTLVVHSCSGMVRSMEWLSELQGREVHSKIQTFTVMSLKLHDDQSASCSLGRFICLLPCLTDLRIFECSFHDAFYKEIADHASSSKIQTFTVMSLHLPDQSASCCLGKFICLLPCLTSLTIWECFFHDEFYKDIADRASSSKIQTFTVESMQLQDDQSASCCLGKFICLLPFLTDLRIALCSFHEEFYKEIADRASSSKILTFTVMNLMLRDDQSASCGLGKFICLLPCLTDLRIEFCFFHDEFYKEIADRASSSKIQIFTVESMELCDDQSASCCLGKFICLLPCLTDLMIKHGSFHEGFYKEIAERASSSKIQTCTVMYLELRDDQSASCCLGRFICLLPCLTDLTIYFCSFHDKFYKEIADRASSSKIQTFTVKRLKLRVDQSASCGLGRFICLLPCLTYLRIWACSFHDEFYKEIADRASSSEIKAFTVERLEPRNDQSASCGLGRFICLLPCLTYLRIEKCSFHDEFYKEIANRASSCKIQTLVMCYRYELDEVIIGQSASKQLAMFLCSLPCLADLTLKGYDLHDDFYTELTSLAASSQIHTFTVESMKLQDDQSASCCLGKFICLLPCLTDLTIWQCFFHDEFYKEIADRASSCKNPYFRNKKHMGMLEEWLAREERYQQQHLWFLEQQRPYVPQPQYPAQLSVPYHDSHQRRSHSLTSELSVGMTQLHVYDSDRDRPSTSGLKSADICRAGSTSVGSEGSSVRVGKRSHSDSDSDDGRVSTSESKQRRSGKRRTKTDRNPDSP